MWTILNSHVKYLSLTVLLFAILLIGFASCTEAPSQEENYAPDAPRPPKAMMKDRPSPVDRTQLLKPVELVSVSVSKPDREMAKLAGANFMKTARDPLMIKVQVVEPIDPLPRASSPVIILNGENLINTWVLPEKYDTLIAFIPDRKLIKERNRVEVVWLGNEEATRSKQALMFSSRDIGE